MVEEDDNDVDVDAERAAAPGVLHSFIKHVKPFSVCFDAAAPTCTASSVEPPKTGPASSPPTRTGGGTGGAATALARAAAAASTDGSDGDKNHANSFCDYGHGADYPSDDESPATPTVRCRETPTTLPRQHATAVTPTAGGAAHRRAGTQCGGGGGGGGSENSCGQQGGPWIEVGGGGGGGEGRHAGGRGSVDLSRAMALQRGKRKLGPPSPPLASGSSTSGLPPNHDESAGEADRNGGGRGAAAQSPFTTPLSKKTKTKQTRTDVRGDGVTQGRAGNSSAVTNASGGRGGPRGKPRGGGTGGGNGDHAAWTSMSMSLSWTAAKKLRKRMEAAAAVVRVSSLMFHIPSTGWHVFASCLMAHVSQTG